MEDKVWGEDCHCTTELMFFGCFFLKCLFFPFVERLKGKDQQDLGGVLWVCCSDFKKVYVDFIHPFTDMLHEAEVSLHVVENVPSRTCRQNQLKRNKVSKIQFYFHFHCGRQGTYLEDHPS